MKPRAILLTVLLAAALGGFVSAERRGATQEAEQWFLDFLVANVRDAFAENAPQQSPDVVLVEFREEDRAEFSAWPPAPLDYIMVLKRLAEHEPAVVAVVEPLRWEGAETEFVTQLRSALMPFPSVVLGFHLAAEEEGLTKEQSDFAADEMPVLPPAEGTRRGLPKFVRAAQLPEWSLRIAAQSGFSAIQGVAPRTDAVPFVADDGRRLVPSLATQVVTLFRRVPYAAQRLRFGTGARLSLGDDFVIPLSDGGMFMLTEKPAVPPVNALELMAPDLGDEPSKTLGSLLGRGKVFVLGTGATSMAQARAIAAALAVPRIQRASTAVPWVFAGAAWLFCLWQLRHGRVKALALGVVAMTVGLVVCMLAFQSSLVWWSPLAGLLVLVTGTLFCILWPAARSAAVPEDAATPE